MKLCIGTEKKIGYIAHESDEQVAIKPHLLMTKQEKQEIILRESMLTFTMLTNPLDSFRDSH